MKDASYRISLDVKETQSQVSIPVKLGDTSRKIYISLTENGLPFPIEEGDFAIFTGVKGDGNPIANNCIIEDGIIRYDFTEQTVSAKGILESEVRLFGTDGGSPLYAPRFTIIVDERAVEDSDLVSVSEINIFANYASAEANRVKNEKLRKEAESTRSSAEEARAEAEMKREISESIRDEAIGYWNAENVKWEAAEGDRVLAEEGRVQAENNRVFAEEIRDAAEKARIAAEEARVQAEEIRSEAEVARVESLADMDLVSFANLPRHNGYISASGTWTLVSDAYQHVIVPVAAGQKFVIDKGANNTNIACLTDYKEPVNNEAIPLSTDTTLGKRVTVSREVEYIVPDDGKYLMVMVSYDGVDYSPSKLVIDGYDYFVSAKANIQGILSYVGEISENIGELEKNAVVSGDIFNGFSLKPKWESGAFSTTVGSTSNAQVNTMRQRTDYIVFPGDITIINDGTYKLRLTLYDNDYKVVTAGSYKKEGYIVPKNTIFRLCICDAVDNSLDLTALTSEDINAHFSFENKRLANIVTPNVKWCAMGDSITEGHISYLDETTQTAAYKVSTPDAWAYKMAERKNWELTNYGIGGTGYIRGTSNRAWEVAATIDFNNFDLVTLAFGVNDWKNNCVLGSIGDSFDTPTTIYGGMRKTIETIIASNPLCKIYVITPINCSAKGDESTNWGLGSAYSNNGTLEDIFNAIKEVCEYYGIEMIDMTHSSIINRKNIKTCLLDNVHPTADTHTVMARELGAKIKFI